MGSRVPGVPVVSRVKLLTDADLEWPWRNADGPHYTYGDRNRAVVDPFPCYHHEIPLVEQTLAMVEEACPLPLPPEVFVLSHEPFERTNGWAIDESEWDGDANDGEGAWRPATGGIVLAGKRIPLHPAMTRYLVAHEYGHHVEFALLVVRGIERHSDALKDEYIALRNLPPKPPYGGRTWHYSPGELLANDFRCLIARQEVEFWPHPDFEHPAQLPHVKEWWAERHRELMDLAA